MLDRLLSPSRRRSLSAADRARAEVTVAPFLTAQAATASAAATRGPARRERVSRTFEALSDGVATFTLEGVLLHSNHALAELLGEPDAASALLDGMAALVATLREAHESTIESSGNVRAPTSGMVDLDGESIHLQACLLARDGTNGKPVVLVVATRPKRQRASGDAARKARARFKLTARETEVTMLLAQRRNNSEIATQLGLSEHTVRHHTERVLRKMGATSRIEVERLVRSLKTTGNSKPTL